MQRPVIFSVLIIIFSAIAIVFIKKTNDHKECETQTEIVYGNDGDKTITEIHMCKEKYNL